MQWKSLNVDSLFDLESWECGQLIYPIRNNKTAEQLRSEAVKPAVDTECLSMYRINPTSLAKPHAMVHLNADM